MKENECEDGDRGREAGDGGVTKGGWERKEPKLSMGERGMGTQKEASRTEAQGDRDEG